MSCVPASSSSDAASAQAQAEAQGRRLRLLFDHLPALIGYWDRDLRNVVANEAYVEWFGVHPDDMRGRHLRDIVGEEAYAQNEPHIRRALAGEGQQQFVRTLVAADGGTQHSQVTYTPDEVDGKVVGLFVLVADVTERVEAERQLIQVNRLNADVLGLVGHDVRQPLSLVLAQLEILAETWDEAPDASRVERVDKALGAARRLSTLLDDILAMANADSGTIATRPLPVSLRDVVVEALTDVHGGGTVLVTAEGDPRGHADPFHLRQMVTNLVSNALRYGAAPVEVAISGGDGEAVLTVSDHGSGVPAEFVPHLFERFRGIGAEPLGRHGSGFGLYIVSRLAEANDCRVGYNAGEPRGSSFWVSVPSPAV